MIARMRIRFRIFPTPKYLNIKNIVIANPARIPLLTFAKIVVKVKKRASAIRIKNIGTAPKMSGSTKRMMSVVEIHKKRVVARSGKKFFLFLIWFLRISLLILFVYYNHYILWIL